MSERNSQKSNFQAVPEITFTLQDAFSFSFNSFSFLFFFFLHLFIFDRERQSTSRGGAERGDTESEAGSRLPAVSTEPDAGLELTNHEIMT